MLHGSQRYENDVILLLFVLVGSCLGIGMLLNSALCAQSAFQQQAAVDMVDLSQFDRPPHIPSMRVAADAKASDDEHGFKREFMYTPDGQLRQDMPVVDCAAWDSLDEILQLDLFDRALDELRAKGFVVLERLLPKERVQMANDEFRRIKAARTANGMTFANMRAGRDMTVPPLSGIWAEDWLTRHPLVMKLLSHYMRNSANGVDLEIADRIVAAWKEQGAPIEPFQEGGLYGKARPILDLMVVIDTPAGAPAQGRHRDLLLPGPAASIGVHIPLTPLQVEPLNGAIGFTPGWFNSKRDIVGAVPQGSVILYDSVVEHHGLENDSGNPRSALFAWYRVPGVYSGHADENFGALGLRDTTLWRRHVEKRLLPEVLAARNTACNASESHWGFPVTSEIVDWDEDRVCFRCDCTTSAGALHDCMWFCDRCWNESRSQGGEGKYPKPSPSNVAEPVYKPGDFSEAGMKLLESLGCCCRASRGRHKLTLLRERGQFVPVDPTSDWLEQVPRDPQPRYWKEYVSASLAEILADPKSSSLRTALRTIGLSSKSKPDELQSRLDQRWRQQNPASRQTKMQALRTRSSARPL